MRRIAIFVDAGYLYAQGSASIFGQKRERKALRIDPCAVVESLRNLADDKVPGAYLLRIYWYDGLVKGVPSAEQKALASLPDVKMRFGFVNSEGQQKGVDTRIVMDLVELARNGAITDALLLSGDEDLRIGVEIAQSYGIRVHLLGIQPAAGSQSPNLRDEADTLHEWSREQVTGWLQEKQQNRMHAFFRPLPPESAVCSVEEWTAMVAGFVKNLDLATRHQLMEQVASKNHIIPRDIDRELLACLRQAVGRMLTDEERAEMRRMFWENIQKMDLEA